jgi:DNA polymerase elongation subunit (family B)
LKILLYDLETMANKAYVWGKYEQNVIAYIQQGYMLCWGAKWLGEKTVVKGLDDYPGYHPGAPDDYLLVKELHELVSEADILIAHNGDSFDVKKMNERFVYHGFTPPPPYKTIDTKKVAKRYFAFNSNKLDDLGERLEVGRKIKTPGFELWLGCENGDRKAWDLMKKYNKQDVILLEEVYLRLRPWIQNHPKMAFNGQCVNCGGNEFGQERSYLTKNGPKTRHQCKACGHWS